MIIIIYYHNTIDTMQQYVKGTNVMEFLTVEQMAKSMGISRTKAYELVHQEDFPAIKVTERRIIIPKDHLDKWLQKKINIKIEQGGL